ncbi:MAG: threonylcarbamoyl-AMP synthase [Crocinitomicaceae bacterium]|nr:threonylcarbamoyl-AMP synthase [Crocinitomicaceae bacterium]
MLKILTQKNFLKTSLMPTKVYSKKLLSKELNTLIDDLNNGGIIIYPTETIWAIGCKSTLKKSVERIYSIKNRSETSPFINIIDSYLNISKYVHNIDSEIIRIAREIDNPPTVIYPNCKKEFNYLSNAKNEIAFRVTPNKQIIEIINELNAPLISTSANISGDDFPTDFNNISSSILNAVDVILKFEIESSGKPSSIMKIKNGEIEYLRK